ncbi:MAG TPA: PadR family transcriptional regulator [Bacteroidales bacterium]|nr:PadR family transcriptional regulator [Bacteroidales bacterium]
MKREKKLQELLSSWEETYKKGQLTLWTFLALQEDRMCVDEIRDFVIRKSNGTISWEEQSLYRALRKYEQINVLSYEMRKGNKGPYRKYYFLTDLGQELYLKFIKRNIKLFYSEEIKKLLNL